MMIYNSLTQTWTCQKTTGDVPTKCSGEISGHQRPTSYLCCAGAAAAVLGDTMYVVAGFHKIVVSVKSLREGSDDGLEDLSDSDDEGLGGGFLSSVEISNSIWALDLETFVWTKLSPGGEPPLKCDKTACWTHQDKVFIFGGFGPPPNSLQQSNQGSLFQFCEDPSTAGVVHYTRGWSSQLVCYNTRTNAWEWPRTTGPPPSPRAAHSVAVVGDTAYVFGGRHMDTRLNDLYSLNLSTLRWNLIMSNIDSDSETIPVGRSWQTMTPVVTGREEGGLVIYGGFDNSLEALGDCWRLDLHQQPCSWVRCPHLEQVMGRSQ